MAEIIRIMLKPWYLALVGLQILLFIMVKWVFPDYRYWFVGVVANLIGILIFGLGVGLISLFTGGGVRHRDKNQLNKNPSK